MTAGGAQIPRKKEREREIIYGFFDEVIGKNARESLMMNEFFLIFPLINVCLWC